MSDTLAIPKLTACGYYGEQIQRLSQAMQGLAYNLVTIDRELRNSPVSQREHMPNEMAQRMLDLGGSAARFRSELEHVLRQVEQLAYVAESLAPKTKT